MSGKRNQLTIGVVLGIGNPDTQISALSDLCNCKYSEFRSSFNVATNHAKDIVTEIKNSLYKEIRTLKLGSVFFLNRGISLISVVLRETTRVNSVSTGEPVSMESEIVRVVSLSTTGISEITRLKVRS